MNGKKNLKEKGAAAAGSSFWLIMLIHVVVFTSIGLFTMRGWRLLVIFLCGFAVIMAVMGLLAVYSRRHPEAAWVRNLLVAMKFIKQQK